MTRNRRTCFGHSAGGEAPGVVVGDAVGGVATTASCSVVVFAAAVVVAVVVTDGGGPWFLDGGKNALPIIVDGDQPSDVRDEKDVELADDNGRKIFTRLPGTALGDKDFRIGDAYTATGCTGFAGCVALLEVFRPTGSFAQDKHDEHAADSAVDVPARRHARAQAVGTMARTAAPGRWYHTCMLCAGAGRNLLDRSSRSRRRRIATTAASATAASSRKPSAAATGAGTGTGTGTAAPAGIKPATPAAAVS